MRGYADGTHTTHGTDSGLPLGLFARRRREEREAQAKEREAGDGENGHSLQLAWKSNVCPPLEDQLSSFFHVEWEVVESLLQFRGSWNPNRRLQNTFQVHPS